VWRCVQRESESGRQPPRDDRRFDLRTPLELARSGRSTVGSSSLLTLLDSVDVRLGLLRKAVRPGSPFLRSRRQALLDARHRCGAVDQTSGLSLLPAALDLLTPTQTHVVLFLEETEAVASKNSSQSDFSVNVLSYVGAALTVERERRAAVRLRTLT
jgi:hypothetical protein